MYTNHKKKKKGEKRAQTFFVTRLSIPYKKNKKQKKERKKKKKKATRAKLFVGLVGFEGNLQDFVPQPVAVKTRYGHRGVFIVCHCHKAKAFTLVGVEVTDDFHISHRAKGAKHLPEDSLIGILAQVVDEDTPA